MKSHARHITTAGLVLGAMAIGAVIFIWSGLYNIGADEPHWMPTRMGISIGASPTLRRSSAETEQGSPQGIF